MGPEAGMLILILLLLVAGVGIVLWNVLLYGGIAWGLLKVVDRLERDCDDEDSCTVEIRGEIRFED